MANQPSRRTLLCAAAVASAGVLLSRAVRPAFGQAEKPKIKVGQVGTSHAHASKIAVYRRSADYDVVGVVEPDDARWAAAHRSPAYRDLPRLTQEQLLNTPGLQAVTIETAVRDLVPSAHPYVAAALHVHLDKPAGTNLDDFRKLLGVAESKRRIVQLGYMLRFSPATLLLRKLLADGALGELFEVDAVMSKVCSPAERKGLAQYPGGMMFELGCHVVDAVVGVLGKPESVLPFNRKSTRGEADGLVDNGMAVFRYPRATAVVRSTALEVDGGPRRHMVVCGTGGTFRVEPLESPVVTLTLEKDAAGFRKGKQPVPMPTYERYVGDAADMAAVIRGEKANEYAPAHDLVVHECVLRAAGAMEG